MSMRLLDKGREGLARTIDWNSDTIKGMLVDLSGGTTDVAVKVIIGATNATPIVMNVTAHGFANNDIVVQRAIGGAVCANGTFKITVTDADHYSLQRLDGVNAGDAGGAYTSGGVVINLGNTIDFLDDLSACRIGTDTSAFTTKTAARGVLDADDPTFSAVPNGTLSHAYIIYKDAGSEATDPPIYFYDGQQRVVVSADAASSATTLWVEALEGDIANGTTIRFTNGKSATLSAGASAGARSLTVTALAAAIAAGNHGDAAINVSPNFPINGNGGNITIQFPAAGILTL